MDTIDNLIPTVDTEAINQIGISNYIVAIIILAFIAFMFYREIRAASADKAFRKTFTEAFQTISNNISQQYELIRELTSEISRVAKNQELHEARSDSLKKDISAIADAVMDCPDRFSRENKRKTGIGVTVDSSNNGGSTNEC